MRRRREKVSMLRQSLRAAMLRHCPGYMVDGDRWTRDVGGSVCNGQGEYDARKSPRVKVIEDKQDGQAQRWVPDDGMGWRGGENEGG